MFPVSRDTMIWKEINPKTNKMAYRRNTMIRLELTDDDAKVLKNALESYLSDLRMEVADTDRQEFRDGLKQEETTLKTILGALAK